MCANPASRLAGKETHGQGHRLDQRMGPERRGRRARMGDGRIRTSAVRMGGDLQHVGKSPRGVRKRSRLARTGQGRPSFSGPDKERGKEEVEAHARQDGSRMHVCFAFAAQHVSSSPPLHDTGPPPPLRAVHVRPAVAYQTPTPMLPVFPSDTSCTHPPTCAHLPSRIA